MHELALAQGIVDIVLTQARAQQFAKVKTIRLAIGGLAQVEPDALAFGFDSVSRGTVAEGAALDIQRPPGEGYCLRCDGKVTLARRGDPCPGCGGYQVMVTGGDELRVVELEVD